MTAHRRKTCRTCGVPKPLGQFYIQRRNSDGHEHSCKECRRAYAREMSVLKRPIILTRNKQYDRSPEGKARRRRYLANGGQELANEAARIRYRLRRMERQQQITISGPTAETALARQASTGYGDMGRARHLSPPMVHAPHTSTTPRAAPPIPEQAAA